LTRRSEQIEEYRHKRAPIPKAAPIPELFSMRGIVYPAVKDDMFETP
jgi:hypothetical protein